MKKTFLFFVFSCIVTLLSAQSVSVYLNEGPRGTQHKVPDQNYYQMSFRVSGLADEAAVKLFVAKCKSYQGVVDFTVKEMDKSGQRPAHIKFDTEKNEEYMKSFLKYAGVAKVYSQNKEYTPDELKLLKQERKSALRSPKEGLKNSAK